MLKRLPLQPKVLGEKKPQKVVVNTNHPERKTKENSNYDSHYTTKRLKTSNRVVKSTRREEIAGSLTHQEGVRELEAARVLQHELMHQIEPLQEHGRPFVWLLGTELVTAAVSELVTEVQPFSFDQHSETLPEIGTRLNYSCEK